MEPCTRRSTVAETGSVSREAELEQTLQEPTQSKDLPPARQYHLVCASIRAMDLWPAIAAQRLRVADMLDGIDHETAQSQSLCDGWTLQECAGHLTTGWNVSFWKFMLGMAKALGSFDKANLRFGKEMGERSMGEIAVDIRSHADHRFTPPGLGPEAPLSDLILHGYDIGTPAGVTCESDPTVFPQLLDLSCGPKGKTIGVTNRIDEVRLAATDSDWSRGDGPEVSGTGLALLLAVTGRSYEDLTGDGVTILAGN